MLLLHLWLVVSSFYWSAMGSGGHPKFPRAPSCSRGVTWGGPGRAARIVGGEVPPPGAVPWQIEIRDGDGGHRCGGVLVGRRLVLSAAHCYDEGLRAVAAAGSPSSEQILKIERFVPHPDFSKLGPYSHDLSFLLVSEPGFDTSDMVRPACLPEDEDPKPGAWCEVSGWGADDPNNVDQASKVLKTAAVSVISMETCRNRTVYGGGEQQILDSMMCAGRLGGGVDSCRGDSGGPLMCERDGRFELVGIVSWGVGCAQKGKPGVYTRVSSFLQWIKKNMRESGDEFEI